MKKKVPLLKGPTGQSESTKQPEGCKPTPSPGSKTLGDFGYRKPRAQAQGQGLYQNNLGPSASPIPMKPMGQGLYRA